MGANDRSGTGLNFRNPETSFFDAERGRAAGLG